MTFPSSLALFWLFFIVVVVLFFSSPGLRPESRPSLHGITGGLALIELSKDHPVPPPCESRVTGKGYTGSHSGGFGISPEQDTPQPPWEDCSCAPSPSE